MWGAWCKTLVGGFSLGEWEPLCPRPTLPEAACNTAGGLGGAVSPPARSGRERILAIMYIKFASNNVPGKISVQKKNPLWGAPNCGGPGAAAPFAPLLIRHWILLSVQRPPGCCIVAAVELLNVIDRVLKSDQHLRRG